MSKEARASHNRARESAREALRHRLALAFFAARESRGLTQAEIARELDIDKSRVSRWFNPDDRQAEAPGPDYLPYLPELLGVDGHWLLTGEGPMTRRDPAASRVALDRIERALREMRNGGG